LNSYTSAASGEEKKRIQPEQLRSAASAAEEGPSGELSGNRLTAENLELLRTNDRTEFDDLRRKLNLQTLKETQRKQMEIKEERKGLRTQLD
jgi:hypothetical protein